jgi:hypothetical protein
MLDPQYSILALSSYDNIELLDIPRFLDEIGGYWIEFENQGYDVWHMYEQVILAYPIRIARHQNEVPDVEATGIASIRH